jgi:N-formylglutamate amidohydrolase
MAIPYDEKLIRGFRKAEHIRATHDLGGFTVDLDMARPYIVTAIHAGHQVREELLPYMELSGKDRRFEEDTATDQIIAECASTICAMDSRAEYDLNRPPGLALPLTPERFWGTRVYHTPPDQGMNLRSMAKYEAFYAYVGSYLHLLLERFGFCVVYDIHSYNISRQIEKGITRPPLFNLGTGLLDKSRWGAAIDAWLAQLSVIKTPGGPSRVEENSVFEGRGEFCRTLTAWDPHILVLPTEIAKAYMDEQTGTVDPIWIAALAKGLRQAVDGHQSTPNTRMDRITWRS